MSAMTIRPQSGPDSNVVIGAKAVATMLQVSVRTASRLMTEGYIHSFKMRNTMLRTTRNEVTEFVLREIAAGVIRMDAIAAARLGNL